MSTFNRAFAERERQLWNNPEEEEVVDDDDDDEDDYWLTRDELDDVVTRLARMLGIRAFRALPGKPDSKLVVVPSKGYLVTQMANMVEGMNQLTDEVRQLADAMGMEKVDGKYKWRIEDLPGEKK